MSNPNTPEGRGAILEALVAAMLDAPKPQGFAGMAEGVQASTLALAAVSIAVGAVAEHQPDRSQLTATIVAMVDAVLDSFDDE